MTGYIKLHRKIRNNPLFKKNIRARVLFEDLLLDAAWSDTTQDWRGKPVLVARGQIMISTRQMASEYELTHRQVRTLLESLKSHNMLKIDTVNGTGPMLITICNYCEYQGERHSHDTASDTAPTQPRHTKEEREEKKEERNTIPRAREIDLNELNRALIAAGGQALNQTNAGLSDLSFPLMWIEQGADLAADIVPTIKRLCAGKPPASINSWKFFTAAVADNKKARQSGVAAFEQPAAQTLPNGFPRVIGGVLIDPRITEPAEPADDPWFPEMREVRNAH